MDGGRTNKPIRHQNRFDRRKTRVKNISLSLESEDEQVPDYVCVGNLSLLRCGHIQIGLQTEIRVHEGVRLWCDIQ